MPQFADVSDQTRAHDLIRLAAARDRLPHAYLFHGRPGVGKTTTAFALAQFLNCAEPGPDDSCGACAPCRKIHKLQHPDVHWLFPMAGSLKGEKRAQHIRKTMDERLGPGIHALTHAGAASIAIGRDEDTRAGSVGDLRRQAAMAAVEARVKVFVVSQVERMTAEAANSLLKILEEPPPGNLLVLVASRPRDLLDTIVSRCQSVRFQDLAEDKLVELLTARGGSWSRKGEHSPPEPDAARLAAALSRGSLTRAALLSEENVVALRDEAMEFLGYAPGDPRLHQAVAELAAVKDRALVERVLDFGMLWLADVLKVATGSSVPLANRDRGPELAAQAQHMSLSEIRRRSEVLREARAAMRGNVYLPLVLYGALEQLSSGAEAGAV